ncbi:transmembrane protein 192 [Genypterus blacodes]|uniref:transmembrane protein 192 n=1 Tax=Genypterus blacodes TaxID=154954 RepID=UPI003F75C817
MESGGPLLYPRAGPSADMTRSTEEDPLVDGPLISADALHSAIRREFQTLPTHCHAVLLSLLHVVFVVLSICVEVLCVLKFGQEDACREVLSSFPGSSVVVLAKAALWMLVMLFTRCAQHHHSQARRRGYLRFYRLTRELNQLPITVHSTGNVLLLVFLSVGLSQEVLVYMTLSILVLELLVVLPCLLSYIVKVMRFNSERAAPDVSHEEHTHTFSITSLPTETGFREGSSLEEVVEKQADLIEYLKQHNTSLSRRLLNLTAQH